MMADIAANEYLEYGKLFMYTYIVRVINLHILIIS